MFQYLYRSEIQNLLQQWLVRGILRVVNRLQSRVDRTLRQAQPTDVHVESHFDRDGIASVDRRRSMAFGAHFMMVLTSNTSDSTSEER